jgi:hypothetical protein
MKSTTKTTVKPNCYECVHRQGIPGDCHSACKNTKAKVEGNEIGVRKGWFMHPFNFDPRWLVSCTGYKNAFDSDNFINKKGMKDNE